MTCPCANYFVLISIKVLCSWGTTYPWVSGHSQLHILGNVQPVEVIHFTRELGKLTSTDKPILVNECEIDICTSSNESSKDDSSNNIDNIGNDDSYKGKDLTESVKNILFKDDFNLRFEIS